MAKDKDYNKLIHTVRWLRLRRAVLTRHPLCQRCEREGRVTAACEVHHIRPVEDALAYSDKRQRMYDPGNVVALCHDCHVLEHTEMGRGGKAAARRRRGEQLGQIAERFFGDTPGGVFSRDTGPC